MNYLEENSPDRNPKPADEVAEDRELKNLLGEWSPPEITSSLDQRILTSYRRQFLHKPLWRRWLTGSISLPAPVAVTAALLLCATSYLAARKATSYPLVPAPAPPAVKFVEVPFPVVQEKIVTRFVYKKPDTPTAKGGPAPISPPPRIDLADFRPVNELKIIVSHGGNDEE
jgi:hypothetical protein